MGFVQTLTHADGDKIVIERVQDCEPVLEQAKALASIGATGSNEMKHAARIPFVIVERYLQQKGISFREFQINPAHVKNLLNDPDLAHFRIWKGAV